MISFRERLHQAVTSACAKPALKKLDDLLRDATGVGLVILLPTENRKLDVISAGDPSVLPDFCRIIHDSGGMSRCITCRSLLAFAAANRGLVQHSCHGGVSVLAAPAVVDDHDPGSVLVVSSCAFTPSNRSDGWRKAREHIRGLDADMGMIREAYFRLPTLTAAKLKIVRGVVDSAAAILTELVRLELGVGESHTRHQQGAGRMNDKVAGALQVSRDRMFDGLGHPTGATLVEIVAEVIRNNPSLPFSVQDIASAAHISPNYLSTLFHQHMGQSFSTYLTWMRITRAQELLRDLTLSIREVAYQSGFNDGNYFARCFKAKTGLAPRDWRAAL